MLTHKMSRQNSSNQSWLALSAFSALLAVGTLSGCVSSSSYEEVSKERDALLKKQSALEGNAKLLRNKVETAEEQKARLKSEVAAIQVQLSDVNRSLDEASKSLDEKNARLSMASEELERKQAALRQTENRLAESNKKLQSATDYMEKTNKLYDELVGDLSTELKANQIKISELKDGITVNLSQEILFPSGSATLSDSGIAVIKKVSGSLKDIPHQIIVAGFTDNVAIKGDLAKMYPSNWELAGARAASVVRLLESEGVDSDKLTAVSFGENKPVASNDDWKSRRLNRRIEIRLRPVD